MDTRARTNPFPGLRPFMQEEANLFFGRDRQSDDLVRRLARRRFLAVVGTSGSGKSSLVRAGLLPALEGGFMAGAGAHWRMAILRPQNDPIGFLARAIVETGALAHLEIAPPAAAGVVETTLRRSSLGLVEAARLARLEPHDNLLVLVDQFEELFRFADLARQRGNGDDAPAFVKLLIEAARQTAVPIYVVITMRSDFLGDCARFRDLPEAISDSQYLIPRLTRDELEEVITGPVGVRGGRIAPSLVQHLLNDVGDDMDQLPVLQHALMRAWNHWRSHDPDVRPIDLTDLTAIGGMAEALSRHADEAFAALADDRDRTIAERLFKCLTERGSDNREIRRPTPLARIASVAHANPADVIRVVDVFRASQRSFLMPPHDVTLQDDSVVDISHESLIRQWGRLRTWVEEEAESRATYLRVVDAARLRGEGKAGLWGEPDLTYARQWQERERPNAAWAERYGPGFDDAGTFLRESEAAHAAQLERERQHAEAERVATERELVQARSLAEAQRQRADEQAAARTRQRRFSWALVAMLALASGIAIYAWQQQLAVTRQSRLALSRQLAARGTYEIGRGLQAFLLAVAGYRVAPTNEAELSIAATVLAQPELRGFLSLPDGSEPGVERIAFSPDGGTLAEVGLGGLVVLWNVASRNRLGDPIQGEFYSVAFSPDGKTLAAASVDQTVILWDLASGKPLGEPFQGGARDRSNVAFSPDGRTLASGKMLWDVASRKRLGDLSGSQYEVLSIAFSPDGKTLAFGSGDETVTLSDVASRKPLGEPLKVHRSAVTSVAFSPDGNTLASAGGDETVIFWNVASRKPLGEPLKGHQTVVRSVAFSPDGKTLASAAKHRDDSRPHQTLILWDVASRKPLGEPFKWGATVVAFSPDGQTLASGSVGGNLILWNTDRRTHTGHEDDVNSVAFSPDGRTLASGSRDQTVILWDVANRNPLGEPLNHQDPVSRVAFSPDGRTLATGSSDNTVLLWDVASRTHLAEPLKGHQDRVLSFAFSPDGRTLASGSADYTVILWDLLTRTRLGDPLNGHEEPVLSMAFSADGKTLVSAGACCEGRQPTVMRWDVATHKLLERSPDIPPSGWVDSAAFSPDRKTLASGGQDKAVTLWDVASRKPLGEPLKGHAERVSAVAFSLDGKMLASASGDKTVILWDAATRTQLGEPLTGHQDYVSSVTFSPDGRTLASGSEDKTVILWDVASRKPLGEPLGKKETVDLSNDVAMRKACAIANRNLTHREWKQYAGDGVPYQAACPELPVPRD